MTRSLLLLAALCTAALAGCARTDLAPVCPEGFSPTLGVCVCSSDAACPTDHTCKAGVCVCTGDRCCPQGFKFDHDGGACACQDDACCPVDYRFDKASGACACAAASCCPKGFAFDKGTKSCSCAGAECCPRGFIFISRDGGADAGLPPILVDGGAAFGACACQDDSCCPVDYRYDPTLSACVCAKSACCPADYRYDPSVQGCVCNGAACCPPGFNIDTTLQKCVCGSDAACGGLKCDSASGRCVCTPGGPGQGGCPSSQFCNALGFCQTLSGCTDNTDCPGGTFCDLFTAVCTPTGPCTLDANCQLSQVCDLATAVCAGGCRSDDDCPLRQSCQRAPGAATGACTGTCENNQFCPTQQFCRNGSCTPATNPDFCASPCSATNCAAPDECLQFIQEGQLVTFCGVISNSQSDCPSGYDCGPTLHSCGGAGSSCGGDGTVCTSFLVENEPQPLFLCASPTTGQPQEYQGFCAPRSGSCPPTPPQLPRTPRLAGEAGDRLGGERVDLLAQAVGEEALHEHQSLAEASDGLRPVVLEEHRGVAGSDRVGGEQREGVLGGADALVVGLAEERLLLEVRGQKQLDQGAHAPGLGALREAGDHLARELLEVAARVAALQREGLLAGELAVQGQ